jgi:hypothetical protein
MMVRDMTLHLLNGLLRVGAPLRRRALRWPQKPLGAFSRREELRSRGAGGNLELAGTFMAPPKHRAEDAPSIIGDVVVETVTVNDKGGSVSAIIKRKIRGHLKGTERCYGAKMEFQPGVSCVLVAGRERRIRISKIPRGFIVQLEGGDEEIVDPTTKAVLDIYEEMLKAGKVKLLPTEEAERRLGKVLKTTEKLLAGTARSRKTSPAPR